MILRANGIIDFFGELSWTLEALLGQGLGLLLDNNTCIRFWSNISFSYQCNENEFRVLQSEPI